MHTGRGKVPAALSRRAANRWLSTSILAERGYLKLSESFRDDDGYAAPGVRHHIKHLSSGREHCYSLSHSHKGQRHNMLNKHNLSVVFNQTIHLKPNGMGKGG